MRNVISFKKDQPPTLKKDFTVCANCKFMRINYGGNKDWVEDRLREDGRSLRRFAVCTVPALEREKACDPISGLEGYREANDLGNISFTDQRYPAAKDINTKGDCLHFKASGFFSKLIR